MAVCYIWTEKKPSVSLTAANAERKACFPFVEFLFFIYLFAQSSSPQCVRVEGEEPLGGKTIKHLRGCSAKVSPPTLSPPRPPSLLPARLLPPSVGEDQTRLQQRVKRQLCPPPPPTPPRSPPASPPGNPIGPTNQSASLQVNVGRADQQDQRRGTIKKTHTVTRKCVHMLWRNNFTPRPSRSESRKNKEDWKKKRRKKERKIFALHLGGFVVVEAKQSRD